MLPQVLSEKYKLTCLGSAGLVSVFYLYIDTTDSMSLRVSTEFSAGEWEFGIVNHTCVRENREAHALTRAGGLFYTIKLKSAWMEPNLSQFEPRGLGRSSSVENMNSLTCLPG